LLSAFDHFTRNLYTPFNFVDVASTIIPIPVSFGGNILRLAVAIRDRIAGIDGREIFLRLSPMVASCIMLDIVRRGLKGTKTAAAEKKGLLRFILGTVDQLRDQWYMDDCDDALEHFCRSYWRCSFTSRRGRSCHNMQKGHSKGHQDEGGSVIGSGPYESDFTQLTFGDQWYQVLRDATRLIAANMDTQLLENHDASKKTVMLQLHMAHAGAFYRSIGGAGEFVSHSACLCCLRETSQHPLPCGHVLCPACVKDIGERKNHGFELYFCPLHPSEGRLEAPWRVLFKPELAGVRVLSLDG
jgi:hypothetical protein